MHPKGVIWTIGVLVVLYGASMLIPAMLAMYYGAGHVAEFLEAGTIVMLTGGAMMWYGGGSPARLSHKDGFMIVALAWLVLSLIGAVPFWTTGTLPSVVDAMFESASGLTTTGATVLTGLDNLPRSILLWRSMQEWLGGMGIIVLALAVMPLLGVGGMQLFKAESPGPVKDKLTARVTETAKLLWYLYLSMTVVCALAYWSGGMTPFDAVNHAMCTVAIGGFSTHDASFGYFDSAGLRLMAVFFMVLAGINFTLHFAAALRGFSLRTYLHDEEFRTYILWIAMLFLVIFALLSVNSGLGGENGFVDILFNVVSVATTTGFAVSDYGQWPPGATMLLLMTMFVGACAGSTGGGMKVVRILLLFRQGLREIRRLVHPHAVIHVKMGRLRMSSEVTEALWGFAVLYLVCYIMLAILVAFTGVDMVTAFSAAAACITNTGPGFGSVGPSGTYASMPEMAKSVLIFGMLLGRLEIYTFFVMLVPEFWRD
ncbi:TrkH family potassium uptake protein [Mariprofundus ferrooxydans]|uniref:Trk system potassium uptake protein n=1 Tax=Mariprofundus ferrooxydans PV-1 TaxID=314345 RepID=Q0F0K9_9PROT|nr:potassium transporter TrkG [Mariprofundus ferrooxydans]EAU55019.1 Trk-type K+ transport system, membrane components [Mariprofundus ferrooxydans PV-1]